MQYRKYLIWVVFFCYFSTVYAIAQQSFGVHPVNGDYFREWLVIGPFFPDDLAADFLADAGGETGVAPTAGDTVFTASGEPLIWQKYQTNSSVIDFFDMIGKNDHATAYAYCSIQSENNEAVQIQIGSDDGVSVWINGENVHRNAVNRWLTIDEEQFEAQLLTGENRCLVKISQYIGSWGFSMRASPASQPLPNIPKFYMSLNDLEIGYYLSEGKWKYHPGDNIAWATPDFDDTNWQIVDPKLTESGLTDIDWQGIGWFRLHIETDSLLINKPMGLTIMQAGESQFYLDGRLKYSFDENNNSWNGVPKLISLNGGLRHVIAMRYSNPSVQKFKNAGFYSGFILRLGKMSQMVEQKIQSLGNLTRYQMFLTALPFAIGLLHLILFLFYPASKQNLFFAFFLLSYAVAIYYDYQISLSTDIGQQLFSFLMHCAAIPFWILFQLRFVYSLFYEKSPKHFWFILLLAVGLSAFIIYKPNENFDYFSMLYLVLFLELYRVIRIAIFTKKDGALIIGFAFLFLAVFGILDTLMDAGIIVAFREMENPYAFGSIGFIIAMSVYLSRDIARTNQKIVEQEMEQKLLEMENDRQSKELEDARQLQLSMLPKKLPQHPNLEIAVFMKTATEVGGDYYDFKQQDGDKLTVAIGDATGHGLGAGTMVSATKSLFHALADQLPPVQFLREGSEAIKAMGLKKMFMALTIAKFENQNLQIAAAGMPFPLIYRSATGKVEAVELKGMPLGGFVNFPYKEKKLHLKKGDTVLLMSDGFEEMFNPQNEMLGDEEVKTLFEETAAKSPESIINHLKKAGETWASGRDQEDDVTFVVVKVKQ